ncbi:MAG: hypothetical protein IH888_01100 [Planctomycetes bacterium]|nr:hypothetical protein [Planctomycetota bacterium]
MQPSPAPPSDDLAAAHEPHLGRLRYVSDLGFVDEPASNEPVWIAD